MRRQPAFSRQSRARQIAPKILVACEGEGEEAYLNAIRIGARLSKDQIVVLNEKGTDPFTIVETAVNSKEQFRREGRWQKQDTAWAVFDGDEHIDNDPDNWHRALDYAKAHKVNLAINNPSLELWYLLHFRDQEANIHRDRAIAELKNCYPTYEKPMCLYPVSLEALSQAILRASKLEDNNSRHERPFHCNPCAGIFRLVQQVLRSQQS